MNAEILTIGDELLIGQIINTNQAYIAGKLNLINVRVARMMTVGDAMEDVLRAFSSAWANHDVVIVTGGLGPTHDDITKKAVCNFFQTDLVSNDDVRRHIQDLWKHRNMRWTASSEEQTMVPRSATLIENPVGTAAGFLFIDGNKRFIVLPGVPYEMKEMIDRSVIPLLTPLAGDQAIRHRTLRTTGIAESVLADRLGNIDALLEGANLAFLPAPTGVRLRITVIDTNADAADRRVREVEDRIRARAARFIYGVEDEELEEVLGRILAERKLTIAVAESCTGGYILNKLTNISGSSAYVDRGIVAYSNHSKVEQLGVSDGLIRTHGAVSREVAEAMATGIRRAAGTDIGLSTTGIAGPTGGTEAKPVGLVWIGYASADGVTAVEYRFGGSRTLIKERASQAALELVRRQILHIGGHLDTMGVISPGEPRDIT
jgi:nicotinamide-nucleotide amidase